MLQIQQMITQKRCYINGNHPRYIVIHETDNYSKGAGAKKHAEAMRNGNLEGTVHYYVDDRNIVQALSHKDGAYAVGKVYGTSSRPDCTNLNSINIEICVNPDSDYTAARRNCIELTKYLIRNTGIKASEVIRHYDAKAKYCPRKMMDDPKLWKDFLEKIADPSYIPPEEEEEEDRKGWVELGDRGEKVRDLQTKLSQTGYSLDIDGIFGKETDRMIRDFQQKAHIAVDGQAGKDTLAALKAAITAIGKRPDSSWVASLQHELNVQFHNNLAVDGIPGPKTLAACITIKPGARGNITRLIQQQIGTDADGIWGEKTTTAVRTYQKTHKIGESGIIDTATWKILLCL